MYFDNKNLSIKNLFFHKNVNNCFLNLLKYNFFDINNIIMYGKSGTGKRTRIYTFLSEKFCKDVYNLKPIEVSLGPQKKKI